MRLIVILGFILFLFCVAVEAGMISSPLARVKVIATRQGIEVVRGALSANSRQLIEDIFSSSGVATGFVTVSSRNKVRFSRDIPPGIRQQLRNVILL